MIPRRRNIRLRSMASGKGFTLLEVLLAFVVFALSFATVLEILSGSLRNTVRAREFTEAALTAQAVMDQLGLEYPLEQGMGYNGESGEYEWVMNVVAYVETDENANSVQLAELTGIELLQIDLDVSWGKPPREKSSHFSTVRAMQANRNLQGQ